MMILRLALDLPEDTSYIRTARLLSQCLLEDIHVDQRSIADVELIVSELCSNVIRHAHSTSSHFLVTLEYYQPKLVIVVSDAGQGFDPEQVAPVGTPRPDLEGGERIGGFGLSLLEGLSDKMEFTATYPHGTTVRVEKKLRYETPEDASAAAVRDGKHGGSISITTER